MNPARPYHHGSLDSAILDLAVIEIEKLGYEQLSLRELAAAVGVSRAAPYRHFPNRLSFLEAVIGRGLKIMNERMGAAAEAHPAPVDKVRAVFQAFLGFAEDHPQLYRLCFASDMFIQSEPNQEFRTEARSRFSFFGQFVALLVPDLSPEELELRTVSCWSFLNGFAGLATTQRIRHVLASPERDEECSRLVVEQCLQLPALKV